MSSYVDVNGGRSEGASITVGVLNFYESITTDGFLFKNLNASNGHNLLKPWCDLYRYGQLHGINFVTLDQVGSLDELDAVIFQDRPRMGNPLAEAVMELDILKYLMIFESPIVKPDNHDLEYHKKFDRIFTWGDDKADGHRYIKLNYVIDTEPYSDFSKLKSAFHQRKLCVMVAGGGKGGDHPNELYSHRIRAIRWFEASAPDDFDLFGLHWDPAQFPSYKGSVQDKLAALSAYRFAICYENAMGYPGYITEKILDCFRAGVVPVYGGAPNIERWIPMDCFIDFRNFQTYQQLYDYLSTMDEATHAGYMDRILAFLSSAQAYPFSISCLISTVTKLVVSDVRARSGSGHDVGHGGLGDKDGRGQSGGGRLTAVQNIQNFEIQEMPPETFSPEIQFNTTASARKNCRDSTGRGNLVIYSGYGDELPIFLRARALWEFYIAHYPKVRMDFIRDSSKLARGEVAANGYDLLIGCGDRYENSKHDSSGYGGTGVWSPDQNGWQIYRQVSYYRHLLETHERPFFVYASTITSVVDIRALESILDQMPRTNCYAGMPGRITSPGEYEGLTFACGTNCLLSSDVVELLVSRYDPAHRYSMLPNDVWQALLLKDVERIPLPFFSFVKPRNVGDELADVRSITAKMRQRGHYHFRIKTTGAENGNGLREDVDPWVMLKVMEEMLSADPTVGANRRLIDSLAGFCGSGNGLTYSAFMGDEFFTGARRFELNDFEV
ncbi:glycosyltransferase family 10 (fucosyltransferase) [mine drainage metagenome]|uniref:Glycosyltransferase family 10 (Fucosyltransferase) n=1 Tax=mine drainage metagenome TaxID=410659 RepID=A0A1J5QR57_9ZZZZ